MSNVSISGGLRLYKAVSGMGQSLETCRVRAGDSTALFIGDAVQIDTTNGASAVGAGPSVQEVKAAGEGGAIYGVIEAFLPQFLDGSTPMNFSTMYRVASTDAYCLVRRSNPTDLYCIMDDGTLASGSNSALGLVNVGINANLNVGTSGNTTTGLSNMTLKGSTANTTATLQLKIIGPVDDARNDPTTANARWIVTINNCQTNSGGTGVVGV